MNAEYKAELDETVALTKYTVEQDVAGNITPETKSELMRRVYVLLRTWQDATTLSGVPSDEGERAEYIRGLDAELPARQEARDGD